MSRKNYLNTDAVFSFSDVPAETWIVFGIGVAILVTVLYLAYYFTRS